MFGVGENVQLFILNVHVATPVVQTDAGKAEF